MATTFPLLDLPDELLLHIAQYATYTERITQQLTCRRLRNIVRDIPFTPPPPRCIDLLLLEQLLVTPKLYTCTHCLRLRLRSAFVLAQTQDCPRGYWSVEQLLEIEAGGAARASEKFLFNKKAPPVDHGRRRMLAASIDAGLSAQRLNAQQQGQAQTGPAPPQQTPLPGSWATPSLQSSSTSPSTPSQAHALHPSLPPSMPRDRITALHLTSRPTATRMEKPPDSERICIDCGVTKNIWNNNIMIRFPLDDDATEIGTGIICKRCNRFKKCATDSRAMLNKRCDECLLTYRPMGPRQTRW